MKAEFKPDKYHPLECAGNFSITLYRTPDGAIFSNRESAVYYLYEQLKKSLQEKTQPVTKTKTGGKKMVKKSPVQEDLPAKKIKKQSLQAQAWSLAEEGKKIPEITNLMQSTYDKVRQNLYAEMRKRGLKEMPFDIYKYVGKHVNGNNDHLKPNKMAHNIPN